MLKIIRFAASITWLSKTVAVVIVVVAVIVAVVAVVVAAAFIYMVVQK